MNKKKNTATYLSFGDNIVFVCVYIYIYIYIYFFFVALQPNAGHGRLILEVSGSHNDAPQSVGFLWMSDQPVAETST